MIGSIIGTGVFTMPAVMAAAGTSSLIVLAVIAVGAMLLAVLFGQLTNRVPKADGGLYAYARHEFGDFAGYVTAWSYWISSWGGNAAIVASWVFYVNALFGIDRPSSVGNWGIALLGLWVPAALNLGGIRQMAWFQNVTVVLKFLPLLFVGVVGWAFVRAANFGPFNASGGSLYDATGIDVHVIGNGAVLIGMGERTTPMAVEILARALMRAGQAHAVIAVELPRSHAMMHLDTLMTMVDRSTFVLYPYAPHGTGDTTQPPGKSGLRVSPRHRARQYRQRQQALAP